MKDAKAQAAMAAFAKLGKVFGDYLEDIEAMRTAALEFKDSEQSEVVAISILTTKWQDITTRRMVANSAIQVKGVQ